MLGYEQPKGDSEGLGLEIQQWNVEQKKPEKQYRIFQPFLPKVPVTLNFWALSYFGGLKDNVNKQHRLKILTILLLLLLLIIIIIIIILIIIMIIILIDHNSN